MDRTDVAAQQARLAAYRKQQQHTKQPEVSRSVAYEVFGPSPIAEKAPPVKSDFQKAHDHAIGDPDKRPSQGSPQLREQDKLQHQPGGMNGPTPPQATRRSADQEAHQARLRELDRQVKIRQQQADRGRLKDGRDHD